jgi:dUTP pyrophosphatase
MSELPSDHRLVIRIVPVGTAGESAIPHPSTPDAAGLDLTAAIDHDLVLRSGQRLAVPTGIAVAIPVGFEGQVRPRSGLALHHGITVLNSPGTIDADYRGEIRVILINHGENDFVITPGARIAQLVVARHCHVIWQLVDRLPDSERDSGGFGSSGI